MNTHEINAAVARMQRKRNVERFDRYEVRAVSGGWTYAASGGVVFSDRVSAETDASFCRDWEAC